MGSQNDSIAMPPSTGSNSAVIHTNGATSDGGSDLAYLWSRYEELKYTDLIKTAFIEELLAKYERAQRTLNEVDQLRGGDGTLDQTARHYEQLARERANELRRIQDIVNSDPFVTILIDGNAMIFSSDFLNLGEAGGRQMAYSLHQMVVDYAVSNVVECPSNLRVACRVYADLSRVTEVCTREGIIDSTPRVKNFVRGFTEGHPLFDVIDIEMGNRQTEVKVSETLKLHLFDYHCRQIFFGCGHSGRYTRLLEQIAETKGSPARVTLLESLPLGKELEDLPFRKTKFPGIFCEEKVTVDYPPDSSLTQGPLNSLTSLSIGQSPVQSPATQIHATAHGTSSRHTSSVREPAPSAIGPSTWASTVAKNAKAPLADHTRTPTPSEPHRPTIIQRNKHGQRLDPELPYDRDEVQRIKKLKTCNQHYIGAGCCHYNAGKADKCPHSHWHRFSEAEKQVLRVVARETPCKRGHGCDDPKCIYGHRCPFPVAVEGSMRGSASCCNGPSCRFPASMHGMDLHPVKTIRVT